MPTLKSKIESLLFVTNKPLMIKKLAELTKSDTQKVKEAIKELISEYNHQDRGMQIAKIGPKIQMITLADNSGLVKEFIKDETTGELTRPQLESLTIIAYRGPITKAELEQIRGVNCSLILRNLMIRGLIEEKQDKGKMTITYNITFDFLKFLGISQVSDLPEYEKLSRDETLLKVLEQRKAEKTEEK
jgi:segregation and condensation protein B